MDVPSETPKQGPQDAEADAREETNAAPPDAEVATTTPEAEATPAGDAPVEDAPVEEAAPEDAAPEDAAPEGEEKKPAAKKRAKKKRARKPRKRPPPRAPAPPLPPELKEEARAAAMKALVAGSKAGKAAIRSALDLLEGGASLSFVARFRRRETHGADERALRRLLARWQELCTLEERRIGIRELLRKRGALSDEAAEALQAAGSVAVMEDLAAPFLPVVAGRATMARGLHLQGLADAIRTAAEETPLSELAQPYVREGEEPATLDVALGGARDILAEELSLDPKLRARLRDLFHKEALLRVAARTEKRAEGQRDPGRHAALVGLETKALKTPPIKILAIRRGEKDRAIVMTIEPDEAKAIAIVHKHVVPEERPHAGFLRAAAEDGYRRILKPLLQNELRQILKERADEHMLEQYERSLRNALLAPYAGPVRTLGLRPDVMKGHRWCAVDAEGMPTGAGQLPHAPTAGREACLAELAQVLRTYEVGAVAVGTSGGRADAVALAKEAAAAVGTGVVVTEVADGGTRALEGQGPLEIEERPLVPAESRGALSLARRFQDPLAELVQIEPKALALGPHMHEVHQGHLRTMLDQSIESCVAYAGVDPAVAGVDLLARTPGFTRKAAQAFVAWRAHAGPLPSKAALAAVEGVGPEVAEQAVGFLRLPGAEDPRDRMQIHPEQYESVEKMAAQAGVDVATLCADADARKKVRVDALADEEIGPATYWYLLEQLERGGRDPRQRFDAATPELPPGITLATLQPGLLLQGRVVRAAPFGIFLDVGLGVEALVPVPHIGEHAGAEPAEVAPVGAKVFARVFEVDAPKKRLTLTMRKERPAPPRPRGAHGGRGPRGPHRDGPRRDGPPARAPAGAGGRPSFSAARSSGTGRPAARAGSGGGRGPGGPGRPGRKKGKKGGRGKFGGSDFGMGGRRERYDRNTPRNISLKPDEPDKQERVDESKLSEEELMKLKLEQLKRKLERPDG